jgi:hypothetical protein
MTKQIYVVGMGAPSKKGYRLLPEPFSFHKKNTGIFKLPMFSKSLVIPVIIVIFGNGSLYDRAYTGDNQGTTCNIFKISAKMS